MIGAVREGNPRCADGTAGPHERHSVNQTRESAANGFFVITWCSRLRQ
jgi:hypothetical protein